MGEAKPASAAAVKHHKKRKVTLPQRIFDIFNVCLLSVLAIVMIYPMWYVICASFSSADELMKFNGLLLLPKSFNVNAYKLMLSHPLIVKSYANTLYLVVVGVTINMVFTSLCAYILSRKNVYWNKLFSIVVVITMFFSGGLIPTYLLITKTLMLNDTFWALMLPGAINVFNMIVMRTSFEGIPQSLNEAARLDGAGHLRILVSVVLPLSKAIIAVMILYYAVGIWNAWFDASIYLKSRNKFPLQLILREILIANDTATMANTSAMDQESIGESIKYATIVFATVPILCVYPYLQKYFTKGVMIGAVKG